jgi:hypothetical protein
MVATLLPATVKPLNVVDVTWIPAEAPDIVYYVRLRSIMMLASTW